MINPSENNRNNREDSFEGEMLKICHERSALL